MKRIQGVNIDRGYLKIRLWLGPKRDKVTGLVNKPYVKSMGCVCNAHIEEANKLATKIREDFKRGMVPKSDPEAVTVSWACDTFLRRWFLENPERSTRSRDTARSVLGTFKKEWPIQAFHTLQASQVDAFLNKQPIGKAAKKNRLAFLKSMYKRMDEWVKRGEINVMVPEFNPGMYATPIKNADHKRERYATKAELKALFIHCSLHDPEMWKAIEFAILTGLRFQDMKKAAALEKVDLEAAKGGRRVVIGTSAPRPSNMRNFQKRWAKARKGAGLVDFHWHDLRHTTVTTLELLGASKKERADFVGHNEEEMTERYSHAKEELNRPWVEKLQVFINGIKQEVA
jgi:integrase